MICNNVVGRHHLRQEKKINKKICDLKFTCVYEQVRREFEELKEINVFGEKRDAVIVTASKSVLNVNYIVRL